MDIANELQKKYDVTIFTLYSNGELENELDTSILLKSLYNKSYKELSKLEKVKASLSVLLNKNKIFKKYIDNDNYASQIAFLEGPITRIFSTKSKHGAKKIAWVHNDISKVFGKGIKSKIKRIIDRNAYEKYDTLVFVSIDNLDKFNKIYDDMQLPHEKVVHNYINSERVINLSNEQFEANQFNKDELNIVQVSRLTFQKSVDRLIKVHAKLIKEGVNHHIYIIGDGPEKKYLNKLINENHLEKTFTLLGAKENPYPYVKNADFFCLFSSFEGYPMVIEEAKILKKFIAITNTSARETLLDYPDGSLIVSNDEAGIEEAIRYMVKNKSKISQKNIEYYYTKDKIIDKIIKIIDEEG